MGWVPQPTEHELGYPEQQARRIVGEGRWDEFLRWMHGQTCAIDERGDSVFYPWDVKRFIDGLPVVD